MFSRNGYSCFTTKVEGLVCTRDPYYHGEVEGFGICGVYVNSSIVDEDALVKTICL